MFTNCPDCSRQFRIRAKQLAQAEGLVQCSFCGNQFNALERLYDKPLVIARDVMSPQSSIEEPEFFIPEIENQTLAKQEPDSDLSDPVLDISLDNSSVGVDPVVEANFDTADPIAEGTESKRQVPDDDYPFPGELSDDEKPKTSVLLRLFWSFGVLLLVLAGTAQAAWFNRDILLSRYPEFLPQAKQVCLQFKCTLIRNRNISAIKLLNRDVRIHPRYEDALLVNATMINQSGSTQRYPLVLLSLYNTNGDVIAYRQVAPTDYLDNSMDIEQGMAADKPVHFVLEVADGGVSAVSFELDFL